MVQHYELMYIVPGSMAPEQLPAIQSRLAEYITKTGGTITSQFDLERRRLAYKIVQQSYGYYNVIQFDAEANTSRDLDQKIRLDNDILRYLVTKTRPMTADQLRHMVAGEKYKIVKAKPAAPVAAVKTNVTALTEEEKIFAAAPHAKHEVVDADAGKVSIEELDKKLDAILEDSDITAKL